MSAKKYNRVLEQSRKLPEIFELVRLAVRETLGKEQAGLMLGLAELGISPQGFIGAFYSLDANTIIVNKTVLRKLENTNMYNAYCFHILLHEYLHSIGIYDEEETRLAAYLISRKVMGEEHPSTKMATGAGFDKLLYPEFPAYGESREEIAMDIEFVEGVDRRNMDYIN